MNAAHPAAHVIYYDGVCALCHWSVRRLHAADRTSLFRFAPLQGETAAAARQRHSGFPTGLDTVVYVEDGRVHLRSRAFLHACKHLGWGWRALGWFRVLPAFLTDLGYRLVASSRYRIFGKHDQCKLPTVADRAVLLP